MKALGEAATAISVALAFPSLKVQSHGPRFLKPACLRQIIPDTFCRNIDRASAVNVSYYVAPFFLRVLTKEVSTHGRKKNSGMKRYDQFGQYFAVDNVLYHERPITGI